ncbi:type I-E CRISPR-associated protein Cas5/CasD [Lujinxingia sediminis]|uniref:Type I-E CRISPR-associated protein Cas5/CasD n=1 Tax=Lujinxingia sediminis TaxID=2480984 RepID=A0ABY0CTS9_9DELT|nr:type I-E CRISPR-associated protein Cas5/CasD [Lujinxingia sediminis]RVU45718.1 type I-E CRISPR-associated protein Cas5/CasD [Lujinxingia sediminis]
MATSFLTFQLYGPMAAWGEVAVGEIRTSADHPTRSAVIGLVAAALGIKRSEEEALAALNASLGFGLLVESPGVLLQDYHTVQVSSGKNGRDLATRRDEVAYDKRDTMLSTRQYRCDAFARVALWLRDDSSHTLEAISQALHSPTFSLYLGRKSCPLALPLNPVIVKASTLVDAFAEYPVTDDAAMVLANLGARRPEWLRLYWEPDPLVPAGIDGFEESERWDNPGSRSRWQFSHRPERVAAVERERLLQREE